MGIVRHAFAFDAASCTGCKACQAACKDKNQLPVGVLWRRVYEVTGGDWRRRGAAWTNTVFAYNVSMACNHCAEPACAAACPADAYSIRDDGIVTQDPEKCLGCEYCAWACPYGAPQFSPEAGRTTKCDFCRDLIDEGLPPACVAACPMRALDVVSVESSVAAMPMPFPLPPESRTKPQVTIAPHRAMVAMLPGTVANRDEVRPRTERDIGGLPVAELPLVAFTLVAQAAAGMSVVALVAGLDLPRVSLTTGVLIVVAAVCSLFHLGRPAGAWRATANAARSPLSREIVAVGLFAAAWIVAPFLPAFAGRLLLGACGAAVIEATARVYLIDGVPSWNTWRTPAAFLASALLLGCAGAALATNPSSPWIWSLSVLLVAVLSWERSRFFTAIDRKPM